MRRMAVVCGAAALAACADKAPVRPAAATGPLGIAVSAQVGVAGARVFIAAGYLRRGDTVVLVERQIPVTGGTARGVLEVDLTRCYRDTLRIGSRAACPLLVAAWLRAADDDDNLDFQVQGPFEVQPGETPRLQPIELKVTRHAATRFVGDAALTLGTGDVPFSVAGLGNAHPITGYLVGGQSAVPVAMASYPDNAGVARIYLMAFENGAFRRLGGALPTGASDVVALGPQDIWVSSGSGLTQFDGTALRPAAGVTDSLLTVGGVVAGGTRFLVAGGPRGTIWRGDGTTWRKDTIQTVADFVDVCVNSATEAFAGTNLGQIYRWDGTRWQTTAFPVANALPKVGLMCTGPGTAQAYDSQALYRWTGTQWTNFTLAPFPTPGALITWSAARPNDTYAIADSGSTLRIFLHHDGQQWRRVGTGAFVQAGRGVWADPRGGAAFTAGSFGRVERFGSAPGAAGAPTLLAYRPALRDVHVVSGTSAFAVGWNYFLARLNGTQWTVDPVPGGTQTVRVIQAVHADAPNNAWAVGGTSTVLRWDGTRWSVLSDIARQLTGLSPAAELLGVWVARDTAFLAGVGRVAKCLPSGCVANDVTGVTYRSVWGAATNAVFAVGDGGRILRYDGAAWQTMASPTTRTLRTVRGSSATNVWALGDSVVIRYDGTAWREVPLTNALLAAVPGAPASNLQGVQQSALWVAGPDDVYIGGERGIVARWNGAIWDGVDLPQAGRRILAISGARDGSGALAVFESQTPGSLQTLLRGLGQRSAFTSPFGPTQGWRP